MPVNTLTRRMRGQYIVIEQVLLFGVGIVVMMAAYGVFRTLDLQIGKTAATDQFEDVGLGVAGDIVEIYEKSKYFNSSNTTVKIPKILANQMYEIFVDNLGVTVRSVDNPGISSTTGLYNINGTVNVAGRVQSGDMCYAVCRSSNMITCDPRGGGVILRRC